MAFDDIKDKGLLNNRGRDLLRQRQRRMSKKSVEEGRLMDDLMRDLETQRESRAQIYDDMDDMVQKEIQAESDALAKRIKKTTEDLEKARNAYRRNVQKKFSGGMATALGQRSTTEDITAITRSSAGMGGALRTAQEVGTYELEDRSRRGRELLAAQRENILNTTERINEPGQEDVLQKQLNIRSRIAASVGHAESALGAQRKLGIDTRSRYYDLQHSADQARKQQEQFGIAADVGAGRTGSRDQELEKLKTASNSLVETMKRLDEATKRVVGSKEEEAKRRTDVERLEKEGVQRQEAWRRQGSLVSEMDRQGGRGKYEGFRKLAEAANMVGDAGVLAQAGAQGYRYNYVTSELMQTQNRIGMAQYANTPFTDQYAASQGDMSALRRVLSGAYADQTRRGNVFRDREDTAALWETGGKGTQLLGTGLGEVADAGPNIVKGAKLGASRGGIPGAILAGGAATLGAGVSAGAGMSADALQLNQLYTNYKKQITQSQAFLNAGNQQRQLQDTLSMIDDFQSQKTADYFGSVGLATRGLGVGEIPSDYFDIESFSGTGLMGGDRARAASAMGDISAKPGRVIGKKLKEAIFARNRTPSQLSEMIDKYPKKHAHSYVENVDYYNKNKSNWQGFKDFFTVGVGSYQVGPGNYAQEKAVAGAKMRATAGIKPIDTLIDNMADSSKDAGMFHPLAGQGYITSGFGARDPNKIATKYGRARSFHPAIDVGTYQQALPLHAVGGGSVTGAGYSRGRGNYVEYESGGFTFLYNHMKSPTALEKGAKIDRGQTLGRVGSTGVSSAPHAHIEVRDRMGVAVDPQRFFSKHGVKFGRKGEAPQSVSGGGIVSDYGPVRGASPYNVEVDKDTHGERIRFKALRGGGDRESLMELLSNEKNIEALAMAGLGMKDIPKLTGMGVGLLGKEMKGAGGLQALANAGQLSKAGYFQSSEQYMQARGALTGVGGGAEDLETIMRNAVAAGMDSSKNIMEMVSATQAISSRSAALGIESVAGTTEMIGASVQELASRGVPVNMRAGVAQKAITSMRDVATSKDMNLFNVMEFAKLRKQFPKANMQELMTMQTADPTELRSLKKLYSTGQTDKAREMSIKMGLYGIATDAESTGTILNATDEQVLDQHMGMSTRTRMEKVIRDKRAGGKPLDPHERSFLNAMANQTYGVSGDVVYAGASGRKAKEKKLTTDVIRDKQARGELGGISDEVGGLAGSAESKIIAAAMGDAKIFRDGVANFKTATDGLKGLGEVIKTAAGQLSGNAFAEETSKAAETLVAPLGTFTGNMKLVNEGLSDVLDKLNKVLNIKHGAGNIKGNKVKVD